MADRGPLNTYEITWTNGHTEKIRAHQVTWSGGDTFFNDSAAPRRIHFHAEIDGQWRLILKCLEGDLRIVRNVTDGELAPGEVS